MSEDNWLSGIAQDIIKAVNDADDRRHRELAEQRQKLARLVGEEAIGDDFRLTSNIDGDIVRVKLNGRELGTIAVTGTDYTTRANGEATPSGAPNEKSIRKLIIKWAQDAIIADRERLKSEAKSEGYAGISDKFRR